MGFGIVCVFFYVIKIFLNENRGDYFKLTFNIIFFRLIDFEVDIENMRCDLEVNIRQSPATPYHHAGITYEGLALTSKNGFISDVVRRIWNRASIKWSESGRRYSANEIMCQLRELYVERASDARS